MLLHIKNIKAIHRIVTLLGVLDSMFHKPLSEHTERITQNCLYKLLVQLLHPVIVTSQRIFSRKHLVAAETLQ